MRFALFYHSVRSDWNHGNAHFLRGLIRALVSLGHDTVCYEEARNWSVSNLVAEHGLRPLVDFRRRFPFIDVRLYGTESPRALERRLAAELSGVDVVVVHEWPGVERPALVRLLVRLKRTCGFALVFHDTHYRILTQQIRLARLDLDQFDAILAYGPSIAQAYRQRGLPHVHVFHEAADVSLFHPAPADPERPIDDALFIGNWGGVDRARGLRTYLFDPARAFKGSRQFALYGVRYPPSVVGRIKRDSGVDYRGWLANTAAPRAFAQCRVALHIMRRQYTRALPGIPTIRVFEALACGAALVSTRWDDTDRLFQPGTDYLMVDGTRQMIEALEWLWHDETARYQLGRSGYARILAHHTCRHRAEQLLSIVARMQPRFGSPLPFSVTAGNGSAAASAADQPHPANGPAAGESGTERYPVVAPRPAVPSAPLVTPAQLGRAREALTAPRHAHDEQLSRGARR